MRTPVLIIGGGISGLSAAYHLGLNNIPNVLVEKKERVGGICISFNRDGFCFDALPHIFFSKIRNSAALFRKLMKGGYVSGTSEIRVFSHGAWVGFPFQTNLHGLPGKVVHDCLLGYVKAQIEGRGRPAPADFAQWMEAEFGRGIVDYFLGPYNRKFWRFALSRMTYDWALEKIVVPTLEQVVDGALGAPHKGLSPHSRFLYPREGGIESFPRAFLSGLRTSTVMTGTGISRIRARDRVAVTSSGEEIEYERLIGALPLFALVGLMENTPDSVRDAAGRLRYNGVAAFHVAVRRERCADFNWAYFAEDRVPFFRVSQQSALTGGLCPPGWSMLICETAFPKGKRPPMAPLQDRVIEGLRDVGLLRSGDEYEIKGSYVCEPAYVIYDVDRRQNLSKINTYLESLGILTAGRYGAWEYLNMDGCIESGKLASARARAGDFKAGGRK